jgi:hypothetical protein
MPAKFGTFGINPIYNGVDKIGKIYYGLDLVYQSSLPTSDIFITSLCKVTGGTVVDEFTMVTPTTTAVEGTQYYKYDGSKFVTTSISVGTAVGNDVATRNANYDTNTGNVMVDLLAYKSNISSTPVKFVINNTAKYNDVSYNIGKVTAQIVVENIDTSSTTEVYLSTKYSTVYNQVRYTGSYDFGPYCFLNLEKLTIASDNVGFNFGGNGLTATPGYNTDGAILVFKGADITKIDSSCLPYSSTQSGETFSLNVKQILFNTTNLEHIGAMGLIYNKQKHAPIPEVIIPDTVIYVALLTEATGIGGSFNTNATTLLPNIISSTSSLSYKTTTPNAQGKYWASIFGDAPTIDANTIGIDYEAKTAQTDLIIPDTVKHITNYKVYDDVTTTTYANTNLYYNCNVEEVSTRVDTGTTYGPLSSVDVENVIFGANVTIIPTNMFYRATSLGPNLYFNQPDGVNVNIEKGCFSYKSATAKNIYTDNTSVKNYDWSTNENITATFYHLDGTAWS